MSAMRPGRDAPLVAWFAARGWKPAPFQSETWRRYLDGESGLLHTPTGSGKTLAAFGGPLIETLAADAPMAAGEGPRVLWVTPLRALAADTTRALTQTAADMGLAWTMALRTGAASWWTNGTNCWATSAAFWLRADRTVLPAFSDFTGGHVVDGGEGGLIVACVDGTPIPLAGRLR